MRKFVLIVCATLLACSPTPNDTTTKNQGTAEVPADQATINIKAKALDENRVEFVVTTTLPTPVEVMASVSLKGQAPKDTYIGHSERIKLTKNENTFIIDTSAADDPLPNGDYEAEVSFYPRWGAEKGNPDAKNAPELNAKADVALKASGENRQSAVRRNKLQKWVMINLGMNEPWNQATYESKLGKADKGPSTMSRLHDAYYFPEADVTLLVNRLKNEVTIWRLGDKTE